MRCQLTALCGGDQPVESWGDVEGQPFEVCLGDIAVAIVVHGERVCRSSAQHDREWVIKRKAEIAAEERRKEASSAGLSGNDSSDLKGRASVGTSPRQGPLEPVTNLTRCKPLLFVVSFE